MDESYPTPEYMLTPGISVQTVQKNTGNPWTRYWLPCSEKAITENGFARIFSVNPEHPAPHLVEQSKKIYTFTEKPVQRFRKNPQQGTGYLVQPLRRANAGEKLAIKNPEQGAPYLVQGFFDAWFSRVE